MINHFLNNGWSCSVSWKGHFWNVSVSLHFISSFAYKEVNLAWVRSAAGGEGSCRVDALHSHVAFTTSWSGRMRVSHTSRDKFKTVVALKTGRFWAGIILVLLSSHYTLIVVTDRKQWCTKLKVWGFFFFQIISYCSQDSAYPKPGLSCVICSCRISLSTRGII